MEEKRRGWEKFEKEDINVRKNKKYMKKGYKERGIQERGKERKLKKEKENIHGENAKDKIREVRREGEEEE